VKPRRQTLSQGPVPRKPRNFPSRGKHRIATSSNWSRRPSPIGEVSAHQACRLNPPSHLAMGRVEELATCTHALWRVPSRHDPGHQRDRSHPLQVAGLDRKPEVAAAGTPTQRADPSSSAGESP
jgi:hypothetical protein